MDKRYQVFVSSTYDDLQEERKEVIQALLELDCIPAGMELFPAADDDQWTLIKKVIDDCDYYIVVVGGRYGSLSPSGIGYTEMEYQYAVSQGKPVIGFLHKNPGLIPSNKSEQTEEGKLKLAEFRKLVEKKMCRYWSTPSELGSLVSRSLVRLIKDKPAVGWVRADLLSDKATKELSTEDKRKVDQLSEQLRLVTNERAAFEKARDDAIKAHEETRRQLAKANEETHTHYDRAEMNHGLIEQLKTKYGWLHQLAENEKNNFDRYVHIIFQKVNYKGLDEIEPYIEIIFDIINASVYPIIIDKNIEDGAVYFNDIRLKPKLAELDGSLHIIMRDDRKEWFLVIRQGFSPELAKRIKQRLPDDKLFFNRLHLKVKAKVGDTETKPHRLGLPESVSIGISIPSNKSLLEVPAQTRVRQEEASNENILLALSEFLSEGNQIFKGLEEHRVTVPYQEQAEQWAERVEEYLSATNKKLEARFKSSLITHPYTGLKASKNTRELFDWFYNRLNRLDEFIRELGKE